VNVDVSQGELGLALTVGSDVFEKAEPVSLVQGALGYLKGFKVFSFPFLPLFIDLLLF
jgi:E3 ubiquitin-protein ligase MUL1